VEGAGLETGDVAGGDGMADLVGNALELAQGDFGIGREIAAEPHGLESQGSEADFLGGEFGHGR
jgi:hypothetical protein